MADKVKEETLKAKVKKYFDLYASIRARKLSGDWDAKRTKLVGDGSVGTNEYGDLFNVLEAFYDAVTASNMFDGIANLDFLTQDQIQALNAAVETIKVNDHDVSAEILRTNGVLSPLTMAMGALDQEERLIDIQAQLSASKLADDIKEELAVKLEQLDEQVLKIL